METNIGRSIQDITDAANYELAIRVMKERDALIALVKKAMPHAWAAGSGGEMLKQADKWQYEVVALLKKMGKW